MKFAQAWEGIADGIFLSRATSDFDFATRALFIMEARAAESALRYWWPRLRPEVAHA